MKKTDSIAHLTVEEIIDLVRAVRNEIVKDMLNDEVLNKYYESKFGKILSPVRREFFKRDLLELLIAPVDLVHYSKLINHIRETGATSIASKNFDFFYSEIDRVVSRY